jgi:hypothetical protein
LHTDKVKKLVQVHCALRIEQADLEDWRHEVLKFTAEDEMCKIDVGLESALNKAARRFKNYIEEEWEIAAKVTKNDASSLTLRAKYQNVFFLDPDVEGCQEVRRILDVEFKKIKRTESSYYVVTQLVTRD